MKINFRKLVLSVVLVSVVSAVFAQNKADALKLYNDGKYKEAITVCEDEIAVNPNNMNSWVVLCWALVANRQYAEAERRSTEARRINNYDLRVIEVQAESKYYIGKYNEALVLFQRYVATVQENGNNRLGRAYYFMGEIYIKQEKYHHADISLTTAVHIEELRDLWWGRLGYAREKSGDWKNAIAAYDKALQLNPYQQIAVDGKARCKTHVQ
ncbi:MAG: tetratricopeptide repeat protein [Treponema sp.]|nr:tetratricopeptide repeat protein [Treponema sp.]